MQFNYHELSVFFDGLHGELRAEWDRQVDDGEMTDHALQRRLGRMDRIAEILNVLSEGEAELVYKRK
jgi:hypothetical protein